MARRRKNRLPQQPVELDIESLNQDGKGVAHVEGKTVFVAGALPGEKVVARYLKKQKRHYEATVEQVINASPKRIEPRCKQFGVCGGCSLQHLSDQDQIAAKQNALMETLKRLGKVTPKSVLPPLTNETPWGYRRKARLGVKYVHKKEKVLVGFRERGTSFITETEVCHVLHPSVGLLISPLAELVGSLSIKDKLPQIEVAIDDVQVILIFRILEKLSDVDTSLLLEFGELHNVFIYTQSGGPDTVMPLNGKAVSLSYSLPDHCVTHDFLPTDFTQVNTDINRKMVNRAMELLELKPDDRVLDLFCGLGNFTLPIARKVKAVVGVEGDANLVKRAAENAEKNAIANTRYFMANLFERLEGQSWLNEQFDKILLDPPRSGAIEIVEQIDKFNAKRIVYVSCYPGTLARDLDVLVNSKGYKLEAAGVMDMFPHTGHVESIALLTR